MTVQTYLIVENNVVTNSVVWDGNPQTWTPPADSIQLVEATTPALIWEWNTTVTPNEWQLTEIVGAGGIGFTWNGTVLTTNEPKPTAPPATLQQPVATGVQTA